MTVPNVTKEEFLDAVRQGVFEAFREALPTIDPEDITGAISRGVNAAMPSVETILTAINDGVTDAMPSAEILSAISGGVSDAMPFAEDIMSAVTDGVKEAMRR